VLATLFGGCGYALVGRGSFLPPTVKTIAVAGFDSHGTSRPQVAESLRAAVIAEFLSRGHFRITETESEADAVLTGEIIGFSVVPITYGQDSRATRDQVSISAGVALRDRTTQKLLYENRGFSFRSEFETSADTADIFDTESDVLDELAKNFAKSLVAAILEGF
jgi:hypothetical protein